MDWKKEARELFRLGRMHHPDAVERFLLSLEYVDVNLVYHMDLLIRVLPDTCRGEAQTIFRMAKKAGLDGCDFADAIKILAEEAKLPESTFFEPVVVATPTLVEPEPTVEFTAVERYSPYYDAFGATPL